MHASHDRIRTDIAPLPFTLADLLPRERVLYLRVFAGTTSFSRRRAVRACQHKLRAKREQARVGTIRPDFGG